MFMFNIIISAFLQFSLFNALAVLLSRSANTNLDRVDLNTAFHAKPFHFSTFNQH